MALTEKDLDYCPTCKRAIVNEKLFQLVAQNTGQPIEKVRKLLTEGGDMDGMSHASGEGSQS